MVNDVVNNIYTIVYGGKTLIEKCVRCRDEMNKENCAGKKINERKKLNEMRRLEEVCAEPNDGRKKECIAMHYLTESLVLARLGIAWLQ